MSGGMRASALLDAYLSGYPQVQNLSYFLPVLRILRFFALAIEYGSVALIGVLVLSGVTPLAAIGIGFGIGCVALCLCHGTRLLSPIERLVLTEHAIFVKLVGFNDYFLREHVRGMNFVPATNQDYDDLQQHGRLFDATIRAKGKRVRVNCWLLITEADADKLSRWLFGEREVEPVVPAALENGAKGGGD